MTLTDIRPAPVLESVDSGDDEDAHIFCCDPDVSLCGLDMGDWSDPYAVEESGDIVCELCERVVDQPCGDPKCPLLPRWWQIWR